MLVEARPNISLLLVVSSVALISAFAVFGLLTASRTVESSGTVEAINIEIYWDSRTREKGVNYLSLYHMYSSTHTTDDVLRRDFSRFQQDGINVISLSLYWYRLEGNMRGSYDGVHPDGSPYGERFLDDIKRVIGIANEYGIKVLITIHTLWGEIDSPWCTPDYVIDPVTGKNIGLAIVRSEYMKQAFIEMVNHTVQYLAGTPGIWAWSVLNEPWYWPHNFEPPYDEIDQKEMFIDLIQRLSNIVKTFDGKPATIRFCNTHIWIGNDDKPKIKNIFMEDWSWDQRIFNALDFISFNAYIPKYPELHESWRNMTTQNVVGSYQHSKRVWITEFGFNTDDDAIQSNYYKEMLEFYKTLPLDGVIAWFWRGDSPLENPGLPGNGHNIFLNASVAGRKAYIELIR